MATVIAIALSGGIDSLVSAALLKHQGYQVVGLHFLTGYEAGGHRANDDRGDSRFETIHSFAQRNIKPLAHQLRIPIHILDLRDQFQKQVVDYFISAYTAGKTPNPCLVCNPSIKFDILYHKATSFGAEKIATGHYARVERDSTGNYRLCCGVDPRKDQSYFLARLNQDRLARAVFPLGRFTKSDTRRIARQMGLIPASANESQDVCFIKSDKYGDFIARQPGFSPRPGPIEDLQGRQIGGHNGLHRYTVGQRRGINCPAAAPYYVVRLDPRRNCLIVGGKQDLLASGCRVTGINWITNRPTGVFNAGVRVRYRQQAVGCRITPVSAASADLVFDEPQSAVTPGQGAVFYDKDEVLGAGWIE